MRIKYLILIALFLSTFIACRGSVYTGEETVGVSPTAPGVTPTTPTPSPPNPPQPLPPPPPLPPPLPPPPPPPPEKSPIVSIAGGSHHSVAVRADGTLLVWGKGVSGELGDGIEASHAVHVPFRIGIETGEKKITKVFAGSAYTLALAANDRSVDEEVNLWSWGSAAGAGHPTDLFVPAPVYVETAGGYVPLKDVEDVSAGGMHVFASVLGASGPSLWGWGDNSHYQLSYVVFPEFRSAVRIANVWPLSMATSSGSAMNAFSILLIEDSPPFAYLQGDNTLEQLPMGSIFSNPCIFRDTMSQRVLQCGLVLSSITKIVAGETFALGLKSSSTTVASWGNNNYGQLGCGDTNEHPNIVNGMASLNDVSRRSDSGQLIAISGITKVVSGNCHSLALDLSGNVWAWGCNMQGQVGNSSFVVQPSAVKVLDNAKDIAAGGYHSFAIKNDNTVWGWGYNSDGQLGLGDTESKNMPTKIPSL